MDFGLFLGVKHFCPSLFFEISEKTDFWMPFIRESVVNLIFRFVPHSLLFKETAFI